MSTEKEVFKYLFKGEDKVELATQKIELGLVDNFNSIFKEIIKRDEKITAEYKVLKSTSVKTSSKIDELEKLSNKIKSSSKELGVDFDSIVPSGVLARLNNIKKRINKVKSL